MMLVSGPATWSGIAPAAVGARQSPIDIVPSEAEYDEALASTPLQYRYDASQAHTLINTGQQAQLLYHGEGSSKCTYNQVQ